MALVAETRAVGRSVPRVDGVEKATGHARYVADLMLPGMLHARVLRSPHAHARIVRLDVSRARALPGVAAVVTAEDVRANYVGSSVKQWFVSEPGNISHRIRLVHGDVDATLKTSPKVYKASFATQPVSQVCP